MRQLDMFPHQILNPKSKHSLREDRSRKEFEGKSENLDKVFKRLTNIFGMVFNLESYSDSLMSHKKDASSSSAPPIPRQVFVAAILHVIHHYQIVSTQNRCQENG